jgi:hypothetical protein
VMLGWWKGELSMRFRAEVTSRYAKAYVKAEKKDKSRILDECGLGDRLVPGQRSTPVDHRCRAAFVRRVTRGLGPACRAKPTR